MRTIVIILTTAIAFSWARGDEASTLRGLAQQIDRIHLRRVHVGEPNHADLFQQFVRRNAMKRDDLIAALVRNLEEHKGKEGDQHVVCFFGALNRLAELGAIEAAPTIRELTRDPDEMVRHRGVRAYVLIGPADLADFARSVYQKTEKTFRREREVLYRALKELSELPAQSGGERVILRPKSLPVQPKQLLEAALQLDPDPVNSRLLKQFIAESRRGTRK